MELPSFFFPVILTFFLFLVMVFRIFGSSNSENLRSNLPPGPWKLPLIGNLHQMLGKMPHHMLRDLAMKYGPLIYLQLGQVPTIVVSSPEIAKEVMKTHDDIFASRPFVSGVKILTYDFTDIAFSPYGDYWRELRKLCVSELLSTKRVQSLRPVREREVMNLVEWIKSKAGSSINLTDRVNSLSYGLTSRAAFGMKSKDEDKFIASVGESTKLAGGFNLADLFPSIKLLEAITGVRAKLEELHQVADRLLEDIIEEHRKRMKNRKTETHAEDLVDVLLKEQEYGNLGFRLTDTNVKAVILDMFGAGGDTPAIIVEWAMAEMMKNPQVMEKAQAELREVFGETGDVNEEAFPKLKYLKSVIKETLRLHPPGPLLLPRECRETRTINGYEIPVKTRVIVNAWAIGRDPKYWNDADRFMPERFLDSSVDFRGSHFEFIPFGAGRRICPGMSYGLVNVELVLAMLLYHFDWKLPNEMKSEDFDIAEAFGIGERCLILAKRLRKMLYLSSDPLFIIWCDLELFDMVKIISFLNFICFVSYLSVVLY